MELLDRVLEELPLEDQLPLKCVSKEWKKLLERLWSNRKHAKFEGSVAPKLKSILAECWMFLTKVEFYRIELNSFDFDKTLKPNFNLKSLVISESYLSAENLSFFGKLFQQNSLDDFTWIANSVRPHKFQPVAQRKFGNAGISPEVIPGNQHVFFPSTHDSLLRDFFSSKVCNLETLHLEGVALHGDTFVLLCENCPSLKKLCLKPENFMKEDQFRTALTHLTQLVELNINGKSRKRHQVVSLVTDNTVMWISTKFSQLSCLSMENAQYIGQAGLSALLAMPNLEYLNISGCKSLGEIMLSNLLTERCATSPKKYLNITAYRSKLSARAHKEALVHLSTSVEDRIAMTCKMFGEKNDSLPFLLSSDSGVDSDNEM